MLAEILTFLIKKKKKKTQTEKREEKALKTQPRRNVQLFL